mgnify:CR=1 FL=1
MASPAPSKDSDTPTLNSPRHWPSWVLMGLGWLLARLPYRLQMWLGKRFGDLAYHVIRERRRVAEVNLRLCFPELDAEARQRLLRAHFQSVGMGAIETALCWWGPTDKIESLAHIEGQENLEAACARGRGIILLSAHFTSLELGLFFAATVFVVFGAGFAAPRVSQTLSPTVFSSPMPNFALQTTDDPSHVHCASWKHLHEHWSIGAAEHKESATFVVVTPIFFMQIGLGTH